MEQQIFEVSQVNEYIKARMDADELLNGLFIRGELSNYKVYPSGHHYFTMKDANGALRCVMFRYSAMRLRFRPENGMKVIAVGRISVFPRDGAYQLYCEDLMPDGAGDLNVAFEQLKARLEAEGLFDRAHKKPLPQFPDKIAIITSSAGAAVHDMIRILGHRWPMTKVVLLPVRVQGVEAPAEIAGAIRYANEFKVADLIITGRGGGSIEDLWAFNDERVARAIYASELPVISAVGHEPDVTISDYVADLRASTPSNAAELAVPDMREVAEQLQGMEIRSAQSMAKRLTQLRERLSGYASKRVMTDPSVLIDNRRMELDMSRERLVSVMERGITARRHGYVRLASALDAMSPLRVLTRGYAIASDDTGAVVKSTAQLRVGDSVTLRVVDGSVGCTVNTVTPDKNLED